MQVAIIMNLWSQAPFHLFHRKRLQLYFEVSSYAYGRSLSQIFFLSRNWRPVFLLCQFILLTDLLPIYHGPIWTYTYTNPCRAIYLFLESYSIWDMNCSEHIHNRFLVCFHVLWNNQKLDGRLIASVFIDNFVYCGINLPVYLLLLKFLLSAD